MRIAHLVKSASRQGAGLFTSVTGLVEALQIHGNIEQTVFTAWDCDLERDMVSWHDVPVQSFEARRPSAFSYTPALLPALKHYAPDIVHLHGLWTYQSIAAHRLQTTSASSVIVSIHGMLNPWALTHKYLRKRIAASLYEQRNLRSANCLHALSPAEASHIADYIPGGSVCVVPNGISRPPIKRAPRSGCERVMLFLGRLHPVKGVEELLHGWAHFQRHAQGLPGTWRLSLVGAGDSEYVGKLRQIAGQLDISASVTFEGHRQGEERWSCFDAASGFILTSRSEAMPMAVLEAFASRLPVIMTPECGLSDAYAAHAALRATHDAESIGNALMIMAQMTDFERDIMGRSGLAFVQQRYTWNAAAKDMRDVYHWCRHGGNEPKSLWRNPSSRMTASARNGASKCAL